MLAQKIKVRARVIKVQARVNEILPRGMFEVELENGFKSVVGLSGQMKRDNIKVSKDDMVTIELSPYDLKKGRITFRKK